MSLGFSRELVELFSITKLIAERLQSPRNSLHLLLGNFLLSTHAGNLLRKQGITESNIIESFDKFEQSESPHIVEKLIALSQLIGESLNSTELNSLHLLIAFTSEKSSFAYRVLENQTAELSLLRKCAINLIKNSVEVSSAAQRGRSKVTRVKTSSSEHPTYSPSPTALLEREPTEPSALYSPEGLGEQLYSPTPFSKGKGGKFSGVDPIYLKGEGNFPFRRGESSYISDITAELERVKNEYSQKPHAALFSVEWDGSLSPREFPFLTKFGRNLTELARLGKLDPLVGREKEIEEILDILGKRRVNNPCLIGEPGVGKTAIVEGLALAAAQGKYPFLADKVIVQLDIGGLKAGTHLRGSLSERLKGIREEVRKSQGKIIIFIDEIHLIAGGNGDPDGLSESWGELKTALSRGEFPCIGATTVRDYRLYIEPDPALVRRFHKVWIREPSPQEAEEILRGVIQRYSQYHQIRFSPEAIKTAVKLSEQYIGGLQLPAKAIDLLDLAGSRARREGLREVTPSLIVETLSAKTNIAREKLALSIGKGDFSKFEAELKRKILGRDSQIRRVVSHLRKNTLIYTKERPQASFLFVGPPSSGKRFFAQTLGSLLYNSNDSVLEIDLSEYSDPISVNRLIGAPPGYVGYDEGGILTESVRLKPYQIVVFSNISNASKEIFSLIHSILSRGELTDSKGRTVSFSNTTIILTLNREISKSSKTLGFISNSSSDLLDSLQLYIPRDILELLDDILEFPPLDGKALRELGARILDNCLSELGARLSVELVYSQELLEVLFGRFLSPEGTEANLKSLNLKIKKLLEESLSRFFESKGNFLLGVSKLRAGVGPNGQIFWEPL